MSRYREDEKWRYEPPGCDHCGRRVVPSWIDVTCTVDLPHHYVMPGRHHCATPGCPRNPYAERRRR